MWFRRRNSIIISNSDIPPAHIAPVKSVPAKAPPARGGPTKLTKSRPPVPKETSSAINDITWPLQRSLNYEASSFSPFQSQESSPSYGYEEQQYIEPPSSLLQDHWGYTPSFCSTISTPIPGRLESSLPPPPPPPVPHFSRPKVTSPAPTSPRTQLDNVGLRSIEGPYAPPLNSPLPDISASPSFRAVSPCLLMRPDGLDHYSLNKSPQRSPVQSEQPVSPISSTFSSAFPASGSGPSLNRPRAPTPLAMAGSTGPAPLRVTKQYSPTTVFSEISPTESFSSPLHTRQPSRVPSTKFNPNPPNELARNRSLRRSIEISSGRPSASTQPSGNRYHFPTYRTPPGSPPSHPASPPSQSPSIQPTQMVHRRSISSPTKTRAGVPSPQTFGCSTPSRNAHIRKQSSSSSISIAIDTADEDAISALEEAVEETVSRPSLSSDRTSSSFRSSSRPVSPMTPVLSATDAPTVMPRPPSPANSARPTSPTCSVRPVSPTQFVITSTPRQSSPVPSTFTAKTVYSIPEEGQLDPPHLSSSFSRSSDSPSPLSSTTTNTTATKTISTSNIASKLPPGNMPTFPSRHEAKKARKAYFAAQAEAKRQSAKMGVEGILGWDAGKRAWVCKMTEEEKKAWLEKMTEGKGASGTSKGRGNSEWGRGVTIGTIGMGVGRGKEGAAVGISGLGVKVVDVGGN